MKKSEVSNFAALDKVRTGVSLEVSGNTCFNPAWQSTTLWIKSKRVLLLVGDVTDELSLQKKRHTPEFLPREISHLRPRTNTNLSAFPFTEWIIFCIHEYFHKNNFVYVHTPIITCKWRWRSRVMFLMLLTEGKNPNAFFWQESSLTVSGQLHVEPLP